MFGTIMVLERVAHLKYIILYPLIYVIWFIILPPPPPHSTSIKDITSFIYDYLNYTPQDFSGGTSHIDIEFVFISLEKMEFAGFR